MRPIVLFLVVLTVACEEPDFYGFRSQTSPGPGQGFTGVAIWVSDSPVDDAESVVVAFDRVELDGIVLSSERRELDLLALQNGRRALLAEAEVPAGVYQRLRIRLAAGHRVVARGGVHPLLAASGMIDLAGPFAVRRGERLELQADFNARLSVVEAGGVWRLEPAVTLVDRADAGAITGRAEPAGATVSAQLHGREVLSTRADADGSFRLEPLPPDAYTVVVTAPGHAPEVREDVTPGAELFFALERSPAGSYAGTAPDGATRVLLRWNGALVALAGVDPRTGEFRFPALPVGTYDVEIHDRDGLVALDAVVVD